MVSNEEKNETTNRVKVDNLQPDQETIKDLTGSEQKQIKGGVGTVKRKADPDEGGE